MRCQLFFVCRTLRCFLNVFMPRDFFCATWSCPCHVSFSMPRDLIYGTWPCSCHVNFSLFFTTWPVLSRDLFYATWLSLQRAIVDDLHRIHDRTVSSWPKQFGDWIGQTEMDECRDFFERVASNSVHLQQARNRGGATGQLHTPRNFPKHFESAKHCFSSYQVKQQVAIISPPPKISASSRPGRKISHGTDHRGASPIRKWRKKTTREKRQLRKQTWKWIAKFCGNHLATNP